MRMTAGFKKMLATAGAIIMATAALAAGTALTYNLAGKMINSCYCQSMGGRMVCSGTCQAAGECCGCMPQDEPMTSR